MHILLSDYRRILGSSKKITEGQMLRRNKHPYTVDEKSSSGDVIIRYVKYRFLHSWVFVGIIVFWFVCSVLLFGLLWEQIQNLLWITILLSIFLFLVLTVVWSGIVNLMNIRLEKKIVYPIVDRLLVNSINVSSRKYRVKRRKLVKIDDGDISKGEPYESIVVFLSDGSICEYPFPYVTSERNEGVIVRSLSLTHYVCNNERLIAKAKSWLPEISLNTLLKLIAFLIIVLGGIVFSVFTVLSHIASAFVFMGALAIVAIYIGIYAKRERHEVEGNRCRKVFNVMAIPITLLRLLLSLAMPFISVVIVAFVSVFSAVIPPIIIVYIANMINGVMFNEITEIFIVLVLSSFIIVYCPSYIRSIIYRMPFVTYTEGKQHKKRLADSIRYVYDAGVVEFLLNVTYVLFVCIICIMRYQNSGYLFSKEIDDVILNAFVVFLSFECVISSYKRIGISAKSFFVKILKILET